MGRFKDEIIARKENYEVLDKLLGDNILVPFLGKLIEAITFGVENWQAHYIAARDYEKYVAGNSYNSYEPKAVIGKGREFYNSFINEHPMTENGVQIRKLTDFSSAAAVEAADFSAVTLDAMDFAARIKLISNRLTAENSDLIADRTLVRSFIGKLDKLASVRRNNSHRDKVYIKKISSNNEARRMAEVVSNAVQCMIGLSGDIFRNGLKCRRAAEECYELIGEYIEDFSFVRSVPNVNTLEGKINYEQLRNHYIIIDYYSVFNKYMPQFIGRLTKLNAYSDTDVIIQYETYNRLKITANAGIGKEEDKDAAEIAKDFIKQYDAFGFTLLKPKETASVYYEEIIASELEDRNGSYAVLTDDLRVAAEIIRLGKPNISALRIASKDSVIRYTEEDVRTVEEVEDSVQEAGETEESIDPIPAQDNDEALLPAEADELPEEGADNISEPKTSLGRKFARSEDYLYLIPESGSVINYYGVLPDGKTDQRREFTLREKIGEGGEGAIYNFDRADEVIKILKSKTLRSGERTAKIVDMLNDDMMLPAYICMPKALVRDSANKDIVGYAMSRAPEGCISLARWLFEVQSGQMVNVTRRDLCELCKKTADVFAKLHSANIIMGDINLDNILVKHNTVSGFEVCFIDADSYQYKNHLCSVGNPYYASPRLHKKLRFKKNFHNLRLIEDEYFAEAVLFFNILFLGQHPYNAEESELADFVTKGYFRFDRTLEAKRSFIWQNLSLQIMEMFRNVFGRTHKLYTDREWSEALGNMAADISEYRLSNELNPTDALQDKKDSFISQTCRYCGTEFLTSRIRFEKNGDSVCPRCKIIRALKRNRILHIRCSSCGRVFTDNEWDICENDFRGSNTGVEYEILLSERISGRLCADCDQKIKLPKAEQGRELDDEYILKQLNNALRNYDQYLKEEEDL